MIYLYQDKGKAINKANTKTKKYITAINNQTKGRLNNMGETVVKRLKDYKGYQVDKIIDNKGTRKETTTYMLNDQDDNNIDCFPTLAALKKFADNY